MNGKDAEREKCEVCHGTHWIVMYTPKPMKAPCFLCNMDGSRKEVKS